MIYSHVIVGGGSAGCVLAGRLSERAANNVLLVEAGPDTPPEATPADILDIFPGRAAANPAYFWSGLRVALGRPGRPVGYEQARVLGGGSSVNGQVATRGAPEDYDRWERLGAKGWGSADVLPFFRRLETDRDFPEDQRHGATGPVVVRRLGRGEWDGFTRAVAQTLEEQGAPFRPDLNGAFEDGWGPLPLNNRDGRRVSAAAAYLDRHVRARPNLTIRTATRVRRILLDGRRASAVELAAPGRTEIVSGGEIVVCAGAIHSPALLLRSGIGPGDELRAAGIATVADLRGVGRGLQEHPAVSVSAFLVPSARTTPERRRHNHIYLRYSSRGTGCSATDMLMNFIAQSAWHEVGRRLATIQTYVLEAHSRGSVRIAGPDPDAPPVVDFALASDPRDLARLADAIVRGAAVFRAPAVAAIARDPFPSSYSDRVRRIGADTPRNRALVGTLAALLDASGPLRPALIRAVVADRSLDRLLADRSALEEHVRDAVFGVWHAAGTCRMGAGDDPGAVTDESGRVRGIGGLRVVDASLMPELPRANTNVPVIMIAEKIAEAIGAQARSG